MPSNAIPWGLGYYRPPGAAGRLVARLGLAMLLAVASWLLLGAFLVDIEGYDGYQAISNSRYWLGLTHEYSIQRGPLLTLFIAPAEFIARAFAMHPLEVRPHHLTMALIHLAYCVSAWMLLVRTFGATWSVAIAFAATVPSFLFFSYSPFLSQDIFPGAILMAMVLLTDRYLREPKRETWILLVVLGAIAAMVKQTYGIFWICIVAAVFLLWLAADKEEKIDLRSLGALALAAMVSGVLSWLVYASTTLAAFPDEVWWLRPYLQLQAISDFFAAQFDMVRAFPKWLYLRNFPCNGWLLTLLIIPALVYSVRQGRLLRLAALVWVSAFFAINLIPFREVRYIAFLAPLSAILLVPLIARLLQWRRQVVAVLGLVLAVDLATGISEAGQIFSQFYRHSEMKAFLAPLEGAGDAGVDMGTPVLTFGPSGPSSLAADRYHRMFYIAAADIRTLYRFDSNQFRRTSDLTVSKAGSWVIFASEMPVRRVSWNSKDSDADAPQFVQFIARAEAATLTWDAQAQAYRLPGSYAGQGVLLHGVSGQRSSLSFVSDTVSVETLRSFASLGEPLPQVVSVVVYRISSLCTLQGCRHLAAATDKQAP